MRKVSVEVLKEFLNQPLNRPALDALLAQTSAVELAVQLTDTPQADPEVVPLLLEALERALSFEDVRNSAASSEQLNGLIEQGLGSKDAQVRALVARQAGVFLSCGVGAPSSPSSPAALLGLRLVSVLSKLVMDEEISVAEAAEKALRGAAGARVVAPVAETNGVQSNGTVASSAAAAAGSSVAESLLSPEIFSELSNGLQKGRDETRIRLLSFFIGIGQRDQKAFAALRENGVYGEVLRIFKSDDLLLKLNSFELVEALGEFPAGASFLADEGVGPALAEDLADSMVDDLARQGIARTLSALVQQDSRLTAPLFEAANGAFPSTLVEFLKGSDSNPETISRKFTLVRCWASLMTRKDAQTLLSQNADLKGLDAEICGLAAHRSNAELSVAALDAWTKVLSEGEDVSDRLLQTLQERVTPMVLEVLRARPFPEYRRASYALMASLCSRFKFAAIAFVSSEDHKKILMDSLSDTEKNAKYAKYELLKILIRSHSVWMATVLSSEEMKMLEEYEREGPFFVPKGLTTAIEEQAA
mmetsp:Transcript_2996/g.6129  ORF Transcript_2996/g.6129 Transcript_2996/m.6129 type:complete len:532 (+) Transcript_2996:138-1733(+)